MREADGRLAGVTDLAYDVAGAGAPVVLLHGGLLDRRLWDAEFSALAATHQVVRVDARGHGQSPAPDGDYAHHTDLIAVLDRLGIDTVAAVGLSLGARTIIDAALTHPHRFTALLLVSPGYSGMEYTDPYILARNEEMARAGRRRVRRGIPAGLGRRAAPTAWPRWSGMPGASTMSNCPRCSGSRHPARVRRTARMRRAASAIAGRHYNREIRQGAGGLIDAIPRCRPTRTRLI